jgi:hypothetical protein
MTQTDNPIYDALMIPTDALDNGGVEVLRAGIINDELYVTARRVFKDPARWGDVLADIARRVALIASAEDTDLTEREILAEIKEAFAANLGAPVVRKRTAATRKTVPQRRKAKATTRKTSSARKTSRRSKR